MRSNKRREVKLLRKMWKVMKSFVEISPILKIKCFFFSLKEMKLNLENVRRGSHGLTMEFMKSVPNFDMRY